MVDLEALKKSIENNSLENKMLIFVRGKKDDSVFLSNQYKDAIVASSKSFVVVDNIPDIYKAKFGNIFSESDDLVVCEIENFNEISLKVVDNLLIVCDNISDECKKKFSDYVVVFPTLEQWQIIDYIKSRCSGISIDNAKVLAELCDYSIFRVSNELDKICLFDSGEQDTMFDILVKDNFTSDVVTYDIFSLVNPIIQHKFSELAPVWEKVSAFDSDPVYLLSVLLSQYRTIMNVLLLPNSTADVCKVSQKQFNFIKYAYKFYSKKQLTNTYRFLTDVNRKLVSGELSDVNLLDYIIINTIQKGGC